MTAPIFFYFEILFPFFYSKASTWPLYFSVLGMVMPTHAWSFPILRVIFFYITGIDAASTRGKKSRASWSNIDWLRTALTQKVTHFTEHSKLLNKRVNSISKSKAFFSWSSHCNEPFHHLCTQNYNFIFL